MRLPIALLCLGYAIAPTPLTEPPAPRDHSAWDAETERLEAESKARLQAIIEDARARAKAEVDAEMNPPWKQALERERLDRQIGESILRIEIERSLEEERMRLRELR